MPRTLENHLAGVTANAPHPESYRPDLPLQLFHGDPFAQGFDAGHDEGHSEGYDQGRADGVEAGHTKGYAEGERDTIARINRQSGMAGA